MSRDVTDERGKLIAELVPGVLRTKAVVACWDGVGQATVDVHRAEDALIALLADQKEGRLLVEPLRQAVDLGIAVLRDRMREARARLASEIVAGFLEAADEWAVDRAARAADAPSEEEPAARVRVTAPPSSPPSPGSITVPGGVPTIVRWESEAPGLGIRPDGTVGPVVVDPQRWRGVGMAGDGSVVDWMLPDLGVIGGPQGGVSEPQGDGSDD